MTAVPSLDPARFLHEHLTTASPDLLRDLLATFIEALMGTEADAICGADYGARSTERTIVRNGYRHRDFAPPAPGRWEVPPPGSGRWTWRSPSCARRPTSPTGCWSGPSRRGGPDVRGRDLLSAGRLHAADGQARGVVEDHPLSKSQVSRMAQALDEQVAAFRARPLDAGPYTFLAADALTVKVREGGRVVNIAVMVTTGVNADGHREILGIDVSTAEDGAGWLTFFRHLTARGLTGQARHLRRPPRVGRRDRRDQTRVVMAEVQDALRGEPDVRDHEAINGIIELHRRIARGYRNPDNYRLRMLLVAGGLLLPPELR